MKSIRHVLNAVRISQMHTDLNVKDYLCKYALNIINGALGGKALSYNEIFILLGNHQWNFWIMASVNSLSFVEARRDYT